MSSCTESLRLNLFDSGLNSQLCHFGQPPVKVVLAGGLPEAARNHPKIAISAVPTSYLHTLLRTCTEKAQQVSLISNLYQSHQFLILKTFQM